MKAAQLIEQLKGYEDFDIEFVFTEEPQPGDRFLNVRKFDNLIVADIGYSDKLFLLSGDEH